MKLRSGGSVASMASIQPSSCAVASAGNAARARVASDADVSGVATALPASSSRLCTHASCTSISSRAGCAPSASRATPRAALTSSVSPSAANTASVLARRVPSNSDEDPRSPVRV
jgi:hypothetical protein